MSKDYRVGKGRPPLHSRFKPGQSGNPKGRPKGVRRTDELIDKLLSRKVLLREGEFEREVTIQEAVLIRMATDAMKGDHRAAAYIMNLCRLRDDSSDSRTEHRDYAAEADMFAQKMLELSERINAEDEEDRR